MKILFAAPDRDLLGAYGILLGSADTPVETAFDGTRVMTRLSEEEFGLVILGNDLPRVRNDMIVAKCREEQIPVIRLLNKRPDTSKETFLENESYLVMPFTPGELYGAIRKVTGNEDFDR